MINIKVKMERSHTIHGDLRLDLHDTRLMERAGVGARSARGLPWSENDKESFQHHAEYLKRLSKLREELIQQEQNNLANALDRLRMRSYGREYVYSQPQREKRGRPRHSAQSDAPLKRNSLITTFEKFQRMRPKKNPPLIMPLEGKSLIEAPVTDRRDKRERLEKHNGHQSERYDRNERQTERSVDENVRANLQRLTSHPIPSIPRQGRNNHRDIVLESSSFKRSANADTNNSSTAEERIAQMQKQKQKLMKLRHEAREAERVKLMPQSFRIDTLTDEDRMNLEKLKDYYCIYYVPAPSTSPVGENDLHVHLPKIGTSGSLNQSFVESDSGASTTFRSSRSNGLNGKQVGFKIATDFPIPPCTCNSSCKMFVSGNKMDTTVDQLGFSIDKTYAVNNPNGKVSRTNNDHISRESSKCTEKGWSFAKCSDKAEKHRTPPNSQEKKRIRVDMPAIVYNNANSPEPPADYQTGLVKAFKQKELRQKELSNLMEDVRELNKITESMSGNPT